jgi:hypothetical protein
MAWKEICVTVLILAGMMLAMPANASSLGLSDLGTLISSFDDYRMNVQDLAFYQGQEAGVSGVTSIFLATT